MVQFKTEQERVYVIENCKKPRNEDSAEHFAHEKEDFVMQLQILKWNE